MDSKTRQGMREHVADRAGHMWSDPNKDLRSTGAQASAPQARAWWQGGARRGRPWRFDSASSQVAGCRCTAVVGVLVAFGRQHDRAKALALRGAEWPKDDRGCTGQLSIPRLA